MVMGLGRDVGSGNCGGVRWSLWRAGLAMT